MMLAKCTLWFNPYFQGLARNLEQPEVKDWLTETKDQLMGEKSGKEKEKEGEKITAILTRWEFKKVFEFFVGYHNIYTYYFHLLYVKNIQIKW